MAPATQLLALKNLRSLHLTRAIIILQQATQYRQPPDTNRTDSNDSATSSASRHSRALSPSFALTIFTFVGSTRRLVTHDADHLVSLVLAHVSYCSTRFILASSFALVIDTYLSRALCALVSHSHLLRAPFPSFGFRSSHKVQVFTYAIPVAC